MKVHLLRLTAVLATSAVLSGCGDSGGGGESSEVTIPYIATLEGSAGPYAERMRMGADLALEEANKSGELPTPLRFEYISIPSEPQPAVNAMTEVASSDAPAVLYGTDSTAAAAIAPIAQRSGLPMVINQSGGQGLVETGEFIFRTTAPQVTYQEPHAKFLASQGVEDLAIIYNNDNATLTALGEDVWPKLAEDNGMTVRERVGVSYKDTQLGPVVGRVLQSQPDAVLMFVIGPQNATIVGELERSGFTGRIGAQTGIGEEVLRGLGEQANGITYATDFSVADPSSSTKDFVKAYEDKYGKKPDTFAATGYDNALFFIEAFKRADEPTREALHAAMQELAGEQLVGAVGPLSFNERDARVDGKVVLWQDGTETLAGQSG